MMVILSHLKEDFDDFYITTDNISSFPKLRSTSGGVTVFIEGVAVLNTSDVVYGVLGILASYYVFNLEYPPSLAATLSFFQYLFGIYEIDSKN